MQAATATCRHFISHSLPWWMAAVSAQRDAPKRSAREPGLAQEYHSTSIAFPVRDRLRRHSTTHRERSRLRFLAAPSSRLGGTPASAVFRGGGRGAELHARGHPAEHVATVAQPADPPARGGGRRRAPRSEPSSRRADGRRPRLPARDERHPRSHRPCGPAREAGGRRARRRSVGRDLSGGRRPNPSATAPARSPRTCRTCASSCTASTPSSRSRGCARARSTWRSCAGRWTRRGSRSSISLREQIVVVLPAHHALARRKRIPVHLLHDLPCITMDRALAPALHDAIAALYRQARIRMQAVSSADNVLGHLQLVQEGLDSRCCPTRSARCCLPAWSSSRSPTTRSRRCRSSSRGRPATPHRSCAPSSISSASRCRTGKTSHVSPAGAESLSRSDTPAR